MQQPSGGLSTPPLNTASLSRRIAFIAGLIVFPVAFVLLAAYVSIRCAASAIGATFPVLAESRVRGNLAPVRDREGAESAPGGDPVFRIYLFGQLREDVEVTFEASWARYRKELSDLNKAWRKALVDDPDDLALLPLWLAYTCGTWLTCATGLIGGSAVVVVGAVLAGLVVSLLALIGAALRLWELLVFRVNRIRLSCPYGPCSQRISLPEYLCPCGRVHRRLTPNTDGMLRHYCECGTRLPTAVLLGRYRLAAQCPHCHTRLPGRSGRATVVELPFVGGTAAGKSTLLNLMVDVLRKHLREAGGQLVIVNPWDEDRFKEGREEFRSGHRLAKTIGEETRAVILDLVPAAGRGEIAYFFDLSGEVMATSAQVHRQAYIPLTRALAVVIDPFAMPAILSSLTGEEKKRLSSIDRSIATNNESVDPALIIQRLAGVRSPELPKIERLAVIITKKDLIAEVGEGIALANGDETAETWLRRHRLRNELDILRQRADEVRYLASGFSDDGQELQKLVRWVIGLDDVRRFPRIGVFAPRTAASVRRPWPMREYEGKIPSSYRIGRLTLLAGFAIASAAGSFVLLAGLLYICAALA
jgi:Double-GTPase 2